MTSKITSSIARIFLEIWDLDENSRCRTTSIHPKLHLHYDLIQTNIKQKYHHSCICIAYHKVHKCYLMIHYLHQHLTNFKHSDKLYITCKSFDHWSAIGSHGHQLHGKFTTYQIEHLQNSDNYQTHWHWQHGLYLCQNIHYYAAGNATQNLSKCTCRWASFTVQ